MPFYLHVHFDPKTAVQKAKSQQRGAAPGTAPAPAAAPTGCGCAAKAPKEKPAAASDASAMWRFGRWHMKANAPVRY